MDAADRGTFSIPCPTETTARLLQACAAESIHELGATVHARDGATLLVVLPRARADAVRECLLRGVAKMRSDVATVEIGPSPPSTSSPARTLCPA